MLLAPRVVSVFYEEHVVDDIQKLCKDSVSGLNFMVFLWHQKSCLPFEEMAKFQKSERTFPPRTAHNSILTACAWKVGDVAGDSYGPQRNVT